MNPGADWSHVQDSIRGALTALENGDETAVGQALTALHQEIEGAIPVPPVTAASSLLFQEATRLLEQVITDPAPANDLPPVLKSYPALNQLYAGLLELRQFLLAVVNGDLSRELNLRGYLAGALKSLQANLRHLTWQTQMIASGDFSQRVDFMGEFSEAFNAMVVRLDESLQAIKARDAELTCINAELRAEVKIRKKTEVSLLHSEERYRQLSITDPLTGIFNRRHFFELAIAELQRAWRYGHPLAVVMMDLDHFKQVNDNYGHAVGDKVLQAVAGSVRQFLRVVDIFARYGGEEFIVLLPETDHGAVGLIAERMRRKIAQIQLHLDQNHIKITVSLGASAFEPSGELRPPTPETLDLLINMADQALYQAKRAGRNRVVIAGTRLASCSSGRG